MPTNSKEVPTGASGKKSELHDARAPEEINVPEFMLGASGKYLYLFTGVLHPERTVVNLFAASVFAPFFSAKTGDGNEIVLGLQINLSQVTVFVQASRKIEDLPTLKNEVQSIVSLQSDILGFVNGCGYQIEITQGIYMGPGINSGPAIFGVGIDALKKVVAETGISFSDIQRILGNTPGLIHQVEACFADLRSAILRPSDTTFYCYRAIETLMRVEMIRDTSIKRERDAWNNFRKVIGKNSEAINWLKERAGPARHGSIETISGVDREDILIKSWKIVASYFKYLLTQIQQEKSQQADAKEKPKC